MSACQYLAQQALYRTDIRWQWYTIY